jgi:hypothetical protein
VPVVLAKLLKITPEEAMRLILEEKRKNGENKKNTNKHKKNGMILKKNLLKKKKLKNLIKT